MLQKGAGQSNNCQIILKLFGYDIIAITCSTKKFKANLEVSEVLITYVIVHSLSSGKVEMFLCAGCVPCFHASRECMEALNRYCGSSLS